MQLERMSAAAWFPVSFVWTGKSRAGSTPLSKFGKIVWNAARILRENFGMFRCRALGLGRAGCAATPEHDQSEGRRSGVVGRV